MQRWQVEVTFEQARAHLGVQTQRQWSGKAIARTTPCLLALYFIVTLAARHLFLTGQVYRRCAAWYPKPQATFPTPSPACAATYGATRIFHASHNEADIVKIPQPLVGRFIDSLCYAT